jgi:DNA-binding transcriptional LysR family regulator
MGKRLVLTRAGRILHGRVRDYQAALARTVDDVVNAEGEIRGLVRLGTFLGFPRARLAPFLASFTSRHPRVEVRIVYAPEADLNARLLARRLDYSLSFRPRTEVGVRLRSTQLYAQELVLVAGRRFLREGFDADELARTPIVDYYQSDPLIARWLAHHGHPGIAPHVVVWAASTDLVLDLVLRGAGVAVLPQHVAAPFVRRRALRVVRGGRREMTDAIWLNEPVGAYRDATLDAFRDALVAELGSEPRHAPPGASGR